MQVNKKFFPQVMQDNEIAYFAHLEGVIASVDELSTLEITKNPLCATSLQKQHLV